MLKAKTTRPKKIDLSTIEFNQIRRIIAAVNYARSTTPSSWIVNKKDGSCHTDLLGAFKKKKAARKFIDDLSDATELDAFLLTKEVGRLSLIATEDFPWPSNVWGGLPISENSDAYRVALLQETEIPVKFINMAPMSGPLPDVRFHGIDWVVCRSLTGTMTADTHIDWIRDIRDRCLDQNVPFLFAGFNSNSLRPVDLLLDGQEFNQTPLDPTGQIYEALKANNPDQMARISALGRRQKTFPLIN